MSLPTPRDLERLQGCHPKVIAAVRSVLLKLPMFVVEGVRTTARQQALYAQGRTTPGHLVTYKDGIIHRSNHQPHADGLGHAVDLAWVGVNPFGEKQPWDAYGAAVEALGMRWGGRFKMVDRPHLEMKEDAP